MKKKISPVLPGVEVLLRDHLHRIEGVKLGLVTNRAGVDLRRRSLIDLFASHPRLNLKALFAPEHGIDGQAQAGQIVSSKSIPGDIPVFSLYGQDRISQGKGDEDLDRIMRSFDISLDGKSPTPQVLEDLEVLVFDLQGVGTRVYTYIATMALCMQVCAESGVRFMLLDRPNPLNGRDLESPMLVYPEFSSYVGMYPIPLRHGMTLGELALLFNSSFYEKKVELEVIPMLGWKRRFWYDDTGLKWIPPSPNMPRLETAVVYPGQVMWEGTDVSEGRGTDFPFEVCGAPWIDGRAWTERLNRLDLPGILFREANFSPTFSKYRAEVCRGVKLHVTERASFRSWYTSLCMLHTLQELHPDRLTFYPEYFDRVVGTDRVRKALNAGDEAADIAAEDDSRLSEFRQSREPFLLYPD